MLLNGAISRGGFRLILYKPRKLSEDFDVQGVTFKINLLTSLNRIIKYCIAAGFTVFSGVVMPQLSVAQTPTDLHPKIEEDHADAAMKWLEGFTNPMREANYAQIRQKAYDGFRQMDNGAAMKVLSSSAWIEVGKSQNNGASGRTSCIAFDAAGTIYLGAVSGGLWKSTDNGANWVSLSDTWKTLSVGGVAVDPQHQSVIYCGTGGTNPSVQDNISNDGVGIYKSVDGGLNWNLLPGSPATTICQIEVNWANSNLVYCATSSGMKMSSDAGNKWTNAVSLGGATSIVLDPKNAGIIYAGGGGQIKKSVDSGKTWTTLSGYPTGDLMILGMSNVSSDSIYLSTGYQTAPQHDTSMLALSTDAGATWNVVSYRANYLGQQSWYANALAVNPTNPAQVVVGGLDIYSSSKAGASLSKRTDWTATSNSSNFSHADIHGLKYNTYTNQLFSLTDGGVFHSENNGASWQQDMNANLGTLLFVGGDMALDANGNPAFFAAGAQDNGTNLLPAGKTTYGPITGGDGGTVFVSPADGQTIYATYPTTPWGGPTLYSCNDGGSAWASEVASQGAHFSPFNLLGGTPITNANPPFYLEYDVCDQDQNVVAICGDNSFSDGGNGNLYLTIDGGASNPNDFPSVTNTGLTNTAVSGSITTVHIAKNNSNYIFIGTTSSKMYYSIDQGATWTVSKTSLGGYPTSITSDPVNETHLFMTVAGTSSSSKHFYISTDTGHTWKAPATNLPNGVNYRRVAVDSNGNIFVGHDFGVLRSQNGGATWYNAADGFPYALVTSLRVRGHYLVAATYGRGMFYLDMNLLPALSNSVAWSGPPNSGSAKIVDIYPSIVMTSAGRLNVDYSVAGGSQATLAVYDVLGREERVFLNEYSTAGDHSIAVDVSGLGHGQHYLVLTANGFSATKPLTIE
jgi:hypothetical protein